MEKILVIASLGLSGFLVYLFDKIWGAEFDWSKIRDFNIRDILTIEVTFLIIFLLLLAFFIYSILQKIVEYNTTYTRKQRKLRKFNRLNEEDTGRLFTWVVYFKEESKPYISDLEIYCTKHEDEPLRYIDNHCYIKGCSNNIKLDLYVVKNHIESKLIHKFNK